MYRRLTVFVAALALASPIQAHAQAEADAAPSLPSDQWYLAVNDEPDEPQKLTRSLFGQEYGSGPPIIVVHGGLGSEHSYLTSLVKPLSDRNRVVFYDQRGSLRSPCLDCALSIGNHVEDLESLRVAAGIDRFTLVSHSMGSLIAYYYLAKYPQNIERMVMFGAIPANIDDVLAYFHEDLGRIPDEIGSRPEVRAKLIEEGLDPDAPAFDRRTDGRALSDAWKIRFAAVNITDLDYWREVEGGQALYNPKTGPRSTNDLTAAISFADELAAVEGGSYILMGTKDYADFGLTRWRALARDYRGIHLVELGETGHGGWFERNIRYVNALRAAIPGTPNPGFAP